MSLLSTNLIEVLRVRSDDRDFDVIGDVLKFSIFLDGVVAVGVQHGAVDLIENLSALVRSTTGLRIARHDIGSHFDALGQDDTLIGALPIDVADFEAFALLDDFQVRDFVDALSVMPSGLNGRW